MPDRIVPGPVEADAAIREAVCAHTRKVFDGCRDKDCVEDLRLYPTLSSQALIDTAFSLRPRTADLLYAQVDVQEITFNRGYYTVDVTYFYRIQGETYPGGETVTGLSVFNKRVMLFGSEASAKVFTSSDTERIVDAGLPIGVVEAVDPINLHMKVVENEPPSEERAEVQIPDWILETFGEELVMTDQPRNVYVTVGQFSIIRLERDTQLLLPAYDYCVPEKECEATTEDDPCAMFSRIEFPMDEFFPPDTVVEEENYRSLR